LFEKGLDIIETNDDANDYRNDYKEQGYRTNDTVIFVPSICVPLGLKFVTPPLKF